MFNKNGKMDREILRGTDAGEKTIARMWFVARSEYLSPKTQKNVCI